MSGEAEGAMAAAPRLESAGVVVELRPKAKRVRAAIRALTLSLAAALAATALALGALSFYWADDLADWRLPGLAALAAIACNVMLMAADRNR